MDWYDKLTDRQRAEILSYTLGFLSGTSLLRDKGDTDITEYADKLLLKIKKEAVDSYLPTNYEFTKMIEVENREDYQSDLNDFKKELQELQDKYKIYITADIDYNLNHTSSGEAYISYLDDKGYELGSDYEED